MIVLGISGLYHDAAAALVIDGELVAAAEEERFSRIKHDGSVPWRAARSCLAAAGVDITAVDHVAYYEDPAAKHDRQLSMLAGEPSWDVSAELAERLDPGRPRQALRAGLGYDGPVTFVPHHLSHAASAYYFSGFREAAVLVLDAVGEWTTASCGAASPREGLRLREVDRFPHSLGLFYSTVTGYLGFEVNDGEYKTMGLAPYGRPVLVDELRELIRSDDDGRVTLDMDYFAFPSLQRMWSDRLPALLGRPSRAAADPLSDWHADVARSAQVVLEDIVVRKARHAARTTGARHLCLAGGVALNCVAIAAIRDSGLFEDLFVQPAAGDAGGALGAAAQVTVELGGVMPVRRLTDVRLGPEFSTARDIVPMLDDAGIAYRDCRDRFDDLLDEVAGRLAAGEIIGWCQGRMEFGPRALGARSILADPRAADMRDRVNALVKMREPFRPFAPAVLERHAQEYFEIENPLPYMVETVRVHVDTLPATTHTDGSARVQTVNPATNPRFAALLERFHARTGCAVLLNTSFNQRGEPIVCTPADALHCFVRARLDALVLEDVLVEASAVPTTWRARTRSGPRRPDAAGGELAVYQLA